MTDDAGRKALADDIKQLRQFTYRAGGSQARRVIDRLEAALRTPLPATASREAMEAAYDALGIVQLEGIAGPHCLEQVEKAREALDVVLAEIEEAAESVLAPVQSATREAVDVTGLSDVAIEDIRAHIRGSQDGPETYDYELGSGYRCFHCGEMFRTPGGAALHFGKPSDARPACSRALSSVPADERASCNCIMLIRLPHTNTETH